MEQIIQNTGQKFYFGSFFGTPERFIQIQDEPVQYRTNGFPNQ